MLPYVARSKEKTQNGRLCTHSELLKFGITCAKYIESIKVYLIYFKKTI